MGGCLMSVSGVLASPFVIMGLALGAGCFLYWFAGRIAPPFVRTGDKAMPYVGGEEATPQVFQPGYQFFYVALFFTVVHVAALVVALAPAGAPLWATLGYLGIVAFAVALLRWEQ